MSHPIPARQSCAGASCNRIDLVPSVVAASVWLAWLALDCAVVGFAVSMPWFIRAAVGATVVGAGFYALRTFVLLEGPRAIRAIEWNAAGEWVVCLGATAKPCPATLANGSFRLGLRIWVLRFATPVGTRSVLVEEAVHAPHAFRRLSRCLNGQLRRASGRSGRPAVTIPPKV
jgi:hypothetical protein